MQPEVPGQGRAARRHPGCVARPILGLGGRGLRSPRVAGAGGLQRLEPGGDRLQERHPDRPARHGAASRVPEHPDPRLRRAAQLDGDERRASGRRFEPRRGAGGDDRHGGAPRLCRGTAGGVLGDVLLVRAQPRDPRSARWQRCGEARPRGHGAPPLGGEAPGGGSLAHQGVGEGVGRDLNTVGHGQHAGAAQGHGQAHLRLGGADRCRRRLAGADHTRPDWLGEDGVPRPRRATREVRHPNGVGGDQ
mmetsp:Transcript_46163/g.129938  ORF Transcript_46163/g.129938 Transcript_46163/m.129938 type:complete len:248 (+) Transcript_46163:434-1177(+)